MAERLQNSCKIAENRLKTGFCNACKHISKRLPVGAGGEGKRPAGERENEGPSQCRQLTLRNRILSPVPPPLQLLHTHRLHRPWPRPHTRVCAILLDLLQPSTGKHPQTHPNTHEQRFAHLYPGVG